jgi:hypothetical protein
MASPHRYGPHYEIGEPFKAPQGTLDITLSAALDASVAGAVEWQEPNSTLMLGGAQAAKDEEAFNEEGFDAEATADRTMMDDMEQDMRGEERAEGRGEHTRTPR